MQEQTQEDLPGLYLEECSHQFLLKGLGLLMSRK